MTIILIIVIFSFASLSLGIYIGKSSESKSMKEYISSGTANDNQTLQELKETIITEIEGKIAPYIAPEFNLPESERSTTSMSGTITEISNHELTLSVPPQNVHDAIWQDGNMEYKIKLDNNTEIVILKENNPEDLGFVDIELPDGTIVQEPEPPFTRIDGSQKDLAENTQISISYKSTDRKGNQITATSITITQPR